MYKRVGSFDTKAWGLTNSWKEQKLFDLPIRFFDGRWGAVDTDALPPFLPYVLDALDHDLYEAVPKKPIEALSLIAVLATGQLKMHEDGLQPDITRYHFVLTSNDRCWSLHDGDWQRLEVGGIYTVDANKLHAAVNFGETTRWHLIADVRYNKQA